jgi:hypothetical protein
MRNFVTPNSEPLAPETVAQMIADFKYRNPHMCDDVQDERQDAVAPTTGYGEEPSVETHDK